VLISALAAAGALAAPAQAAPTGYFTQNGIGPLHHLRSGFFAAPLPDGTVLVGGSVSETTAEIFHPAAGAFSAAGVGELAVARGFPGAAPLPDGRVLVVGGINPEATLSSTEIFDPATGEFTSGPELSVPRAGPAVAPLPDGRVLIAGGHLVDEFADITVYGSAEIYDPASGEITTAGVGELDTPRTAAAAAPLPDGRVPIAGGATDGLLTYLSTAEVFDPATGEFSSVGGMTTARWEAAAAPLPDGRVLVAGGSPSAASPLDTAEIFDPATGEFSSEGVGRMTVARQGPAASPLADGRVLIAGGVGEVSEVGTSAEVFVPPPAPTSRGLNFGDVRVGASAGVRPLRVVNRGAQALLPGRAVVGGPARRDYAIVADDCRRERLQFRDWCEIEIRFRPSKRGARNARLVFPSNATDEPLAFPLRGKGVGPKKKKAACARKGKRAKGKRRAGKRKCRR
jgi:hypothetical protein